MVRSASHGTRQGKQKAEWSQFGRVMTQFSELWDSADTSSRLFLARRARLNLSSLGGLQL